MDALNKAQKMVLMVRMMSSRGGVRANELIDRFGLDSRSMRRYLSDLRDIDVPIIDEGRGDLRTISVDPRWRRTGVQLTLTEVLSLHFGRTLFNFLEGTSFAADLDDAIERLEPAVSRAHQDIARQLDTKFLAVREQTKDYRGGANEMIDDVISALVYNNVLEGQYRKASGVSKRYRLHPFTLATYRQGLYLFALDTSVSQVKTFAVERFVDLRRTRERFDYPRGWNPTTHIAHAFGIIDGEPIEARVAFNPREAAYIRERTWHPTQQYGTLPDGRLELRLSVANTVELRQWVLSFGSACEVLSPPELVHQVGEELRAAAARYEGTLA